MLLLIRGAFNVMFASRSFFFRAWAVRYSASSTVIAHAVYGHVVDNSFVVHMHICDVHVIHCTVIGEVAMIPISAFVAVTYVSETVVHSTVKADMRTPISGVPNVGAFAPSTITGCPEEADLRRHDPRARHPVIPVIAICPITGRPNVALAGTKRLCVNR
jgi:hypothetical protein